VNKHIIVILQPSTPGLENLHQRKKQQDRILFCNENTVLLVLVSLKLEY